VVAPYEDYAVTSSTPGGPVFRVGCGDDWLQIDGASGALLEKLDWSRRCCFTCGFDGGLVARRNHLVNVVLYRERYGKTPWTAAELAAIQDSCLKTACRSLLFVQLDKKDPQPVWLPDTHIRCVLGDFTIEQLAGIIMNKVQELGGVIHRPNAMSEAQRVKRKPSTSLIAMR
jgi:hypothetical protein